MQPREDACVVWDTGCPHDGSLGARAAPSGNIGIFVQDRVGGRRSKKTLHKKLNAFVHSGGSVNGLRKEARDFVLAAQARGLTTTDQSRADAIETRERRAGAKTIRELGEDYLAFRAANAPYADGGRAAQGAIERAASVWNDTPVARLRRKDGPALMNYIVEDAVRTAKKRGTPLGRHPGHEVAKPARALLLAMLDYASDELPEIRTDLFRLWRPGTNGPRRAVLSKEESVAFFEALIEFEKPQKYRRGRRHSVSKDTADILRPTYQCAARKSDWLQLAWGGLDPKTATWVRPEHKRKQGTEQMQLPTRDVIFIFERIRARREADGGPHGVGGFVFPSVTRTGKRHRTSLWDAFQTITADLNADRPVEERITPHTLRASRITEWRDAYRWSFAEIARLMGKMSEMVETVHYRPRYDVEAFRAEIEVASDADPSMETTHCA